MAMYNEGNVVENSLPETYLEYPSTDFSTPVYNQQITITQQPRNNQQQEQGRNKNRNNNVEEFDLTDLTVEDFPGARRPIPVSTIDWRSTDRSQFIPIHGLDFLIGVMHLQIQQTVELGDIVSNVEVENKYVVKVPQGETLYIASELSSGLQRLFCGSRRKLTISISDHTRQEALLLYRRLAASTCLFPCRLQEIYVVAPPGEYIGKVSQQCTITVPFFLIYGNRDEVLYIIEGPAINQCCTNLDVEFKILSGDVMMQKGTITHLWDGRLANYVMTINFPTDSADPGVKALILGAAFLLEYTYFARAKSSKCLSICC